MPFWTPAMWSGVSSDVRRSRKRIDSAMRRGYATFEDRVAILSTQETAAELSQ